MSVEKNRLKRVFWKGGREREREREKRERERERERKERERKMERSVADKMEREA